MLTLLRFALAVACCAFSTDAGHSVLTRRYFDGKCKVFRGAGSELFVAAYDKYRSQQEAASKCRSEGGKLADLADHWIWQSKTDIGMGQFKNNLSVFKQDSDIASFWIAGRTPKPDLSRIEQWNIPYNYGNSCRILTDRIDINRTFVTFARNCSTKLYPLCDMSPDVSLLSEDAPTWQINDQYNDKGKSHAAVDYSEYGDFNWGSCSHTKSSPQAWWAVDLTGFTRIVGVLIKNRHDCCSEHLRNFYIRASNTAPDKHQFSDVSDVCATYPGTMASNEFRMFECYALARYVYVQLREIGPLVLCRVAVYGAHIDNLARRGIASQSSDHYDATSKANEAIDGDLNGGDLGTCTHTTLESQPWWAVDLGMLVEIVAVAIKNREDCCWERLSDFQIGTTNTRLAELASNNTHIGRSYHTCNHYTSKMDQAEYKIFPCYAMSQNVIIQLNGQGYLTLCEVEVFGAPTPERLCTQEEESLAACLNGGYCYVPMDDDKVVVSCRCPESWTGNRCQESKYRCHDNFTKYENHEARGGSIAASEKTFGDCLQACLDANTCFGFDWNARGQNLSLTGSTIDLYRERRVHCFLFHDELNVLVYYPKNGVDHYIRYRCEPSVWTTTTFPSQEDSGECSEHMEAYKNQKLKINPAARYEQIKQWLTECYWTCQNDVKCFALEYQLYDNNPYCYLHYDKPALGVAPSTWGNFTAYVKVPCTTPATTPKEECFEYMTAHRNQTIIRNPNARYEQIGGGLRECNRTCLSDANCFAFDYLLYDKNSYCYIHLDKPALGVAPSAWGNFTAYVKVLCTTPGHHPQVVTPHFLGNDVEYAGEPVQQSSEHQLGSSMEYKIAGTAVGAVVLLLLVVVVAIVLVRRTKKDHGDNEPFAECDKTTRLPKKVN